MITKLSCKDIKMLESSVKNDVSKSALEEYLSAHKKAETAWKVFRDSLVLSESSSEDNTSKEVKSEKKRKFKVGDKVRVLDVSFAMATSALDVGDITKVVGYKKDFREYELLVPKERPVVVAEPEGETGLFEESALELIEEKSPNELRAEIIEKAKKFVGQYHTKCVFSKDGWTYVTRLYFEVNKEKGAVVALLKGINSNKLKARGIAKCNPDDVFNEHIGKAIALGRALGKDVSEFENAVQPTEPVIGHVVKGNENLGFYRPDHKFTLTSKQGCDSFYYAEWRERDPESLGDYIYSTQIGTIIDDTNAIY